MKRIPGLEASSANRTRAQAVFMALTLAAVSCAQGRFSDLRFIGPDGKSGRMALVSRDGSVQAGKESVIYDGDRFKFPRMDRLPSESSLIVEYRSVGMSGASVTLISQAAGAEKAQETASWALALSSSPVSFCLPVKAGFLPKEIVFSLNGGKGELRLERIRVDGSGSFYGFERSDGRILLSPGCSITASLGGGQKLNLPLDGAGRGAFCLSIRYSMESGKTASVRGAGLDAILLPDSGERPVSIPLAISGGAGVELEMPGAFVLDSFVLRPSGQAAIAADPLAMLDWRRGDFRRDGYELFRWDAFPQVLVLLFSDYAQQDLALKRLAFFAEKAGFRGRLAADGEIRALHGWNAHDYPASTLARFFSLALSEKFPLNHQEIELRNLLENDGVIVRGKASWTAGQGALLSVSLESSRAMRERFMAHEGFHGIYFTDGEFRKRVKEIWDGVDADLRGYIIEFFDFKELDSGDPELMTNEFASYFLQTPFREAPGYFAGTVADFLEADRGGDGRYRRFADAHRGEFLAIAEELDALVNELYGLASGRVWRTGKPKA